VDTKMKKLIKRIVKDSNAEKTDNLQSKVKLQKRIANTAEHCMVVVTLHIYWMVDHVTSHRTFSIPATLVHYKKLINGLDDEACLLGVDIIKPSQVT
jgi:hypothetical protein